MMHTNGGDVWYIIDTKTRMQKSFRSQAQAREFFVKWSEDEPGRYEMKLYDSSTMTFLND